MPPGDTTSDRSFDDAAIAGRIAEAVAPMIRLADAHGYAMLAYLLELAKIEADKQASDIRRPAKHDA